MLNFFEKVYVLISSSSTTTSSVSLYYPAKVTPTLRPFSRLEKTSGYVIPKSKIKSHFGGKSGEGGCQQLELPVEPKQ
jgi:hypothetical protein